jgi:DHA1 family bicyclomycin/chloramphenicol resistance-like MFS transporter
MPGFVRNAVVLGLLTAIGPFAIDMYLPSLPSVATALHTDDAGALSSMSVFFITFAIGQLVYGPSSDLLGRRRPLVAGMLLFIAASVGCALAQTIDQLVVFRAIQGFGGAAGMVIARAIVRDLHSGLEEARLFSLLMLVFSVSPILAPLAGNGVIALTSWRGVFWLVGALAALDLVLIAAYVPETLPPSRRRDARIRDVVRACRVLVADRGFVGLTLVSSFAFSGFLLYLANSPFVMSSYYGLSRLGYSLAFSINALAFCAGAQLTGWLGQRFGLRRLLGPATLGYAAVMTLAAALAWLGFDGLALVGALLFVGYSFLGIIMPVASVLALEDHGAIAGTAASLLSALQLATGSLCVWISGLFSTGGAVPMLGAIAGATVIAAISQAVARR